MINLKNPRVAKIAVFDVDVLIVTNKKEFIELQSILGKEGEIPEHFKEAYDANNGYACLLEYQNLPYFVLVLKSRNALIHESIHIAEMILEHKGINFRLKCMAEVRAFFIDYVIKMVRAAI